MKSIPEKLKFENKQLLVSIPLLIATLFLTTTIVEIILIVLVFLLLFVIMTRNYLRYYDSIRITEERLSKLKAFTREDDGSFSDYGDFGIVPFINREGISVDWYLTTFNEVDGSKSVIKRLRSMDDLKRTYEILTNKELEL